MARTTTKRLPIPILVLGMLITGCSNSLWIKWQDRHIIQNGSHPSSLLQLQLSPQLSSQLSPQPSLFVASISPPQPSLISFLSPPSESESESESLSQLPSQPASSLIYDSSVDSFNSVQPSYIHSSSVGRQSDDELQQQHPQQQQHFEQPILQTYNMFIGEMACLFVVYAIKASYLWRRNRTGTIRIGDDEPATIVHEHTVDDEDLHESEAARHDILSSSLGSIPSSLEEQTSSSSTSAASSKRTAVESLSAASDTPLPHSVPSSSPTVFWLLVPTMGDIIGTTLMNVGLMHVDVSIFQMMRGALVIWVALLAVTCLRSTIKPYQWFALLCVMSGVILVGLSGALYRRAVEPELPLWLLLSPPSMSSASSLSSSAAFVGLKEEATATRTIFGIAATVLAQLFTAGQFVMEEQLVGRQGIDPLTAVGYEGLFGVLILTVITPIIMYFNGDFGSFKSTESSRYLDIKTGLNQLTNDRALALSCVAIAACIAFFNWFGMSVTQRVSSTARSTIDTCRTVLIWFVSLYLGWETWNGIYSAGQLLGFAILVYGTAVFNDVVRLPRFRSAGRNEYDGVPDSEREPLLNSQGT